MEELSQSLRSRQRAAAVGFRVTISYVVGRHTMIGFDFNSLATMTADVI